jgi:hypothetical protein
VRGAPASFAVIAIAGQGSTGTIGKTALTNSSPYAISAFAGATLKLDEVEISGTRNAGLLVGDRNSAPAHAEVKRSHFNQNGAGIGVVGGSSVDIEESEARENEDGVAVLDRESRATLRKTALAANRDMGLYVHNNAQASAIDCDFQNNARGAQSGTARKSAERASVSLENCRFAGNRVFAAGACTDSELILNGCSFDGTDKTKIYKERGATVQSDALAENSPSPSASPQSSADSEKSENQTHRKRKGSATRKRSDDDVYKWIRRFHP